MDGVVWKDGMRCSVSSPTPTRTDPLLWLFHLPDCLFLQLVCLRSEAWAWDPSVLWTVHQALACALVVVSVSRWLACQFADGTLSKCNQGSHL